MCKTNPKEFIKFHELIKDYNPTYMVVSPRSKIRNKTFKKEPFDVVLSMMKRGYNVALLANENSPLIILDIDHPEKIDTYPETLKCISGSRRGFHLIYISEDKIDNYNGPAGELQAINKYIITPGSFVPNENNTGEYFISEVREPAKISLRTLPEAFVRPPEEKISTTMPKKNSALNSLKMEDLFKQPENRNFESPFHGSNGGCNTRISNGLLHCYRCNVYHTPKTALAVLAGMIDCSDGFKHRGDKTLNKEINETELFVWAVYNGYIKEE